MSSKKKKSRFPKRVLKRYAEIVLRQVYASGGRDRYVAVREIEDALGLEPALVLELCRTRLRGEVHVAYRLPADVEERAGFLEPLEREFLHCYFAKPHVRVRRDAVRLTEAELVDTPRKRKK